MGDLVGVRARRPCRRRDEQRADQRSPSRRSARRSRRARRGGRRPSGDGTRLAPRDAAGRRLVRVGPTVRRTANGTPPSRRTGCERRVVRGPAIAPQVGLRGSRRSGGRGPSRPPDAATVAGAALPLPCGVHAHLLGHPADRPQAPRQLHRRDQPVRRRPGPRRRRSTASSTCTRSPSRSTRPSCASAPYDTTAHPARRRPRPGALHPLPPERRHEHTELTWLLGASPPTATSTACTSSRRSRPPSASWSPPGCSSTRC